VNFNGGGMVLDCIASALAQTIADRLEVIVLDNASTDGSCSAIEKLYAGRVRLLRSERNLGFAGGNNLAFASASGKYLLLLNTDAVAEPSWAEELVAAADSGKNVGMCTPRILCSPDSSRLDNAGHLIYPDGLNRSRGHMRPAAGLFERREEALLASGCAGLYLREPVMSLGGFDEDFFAYGDDTDLGLRLRLIGYGCLYVPGAVVRHRQSASAGAFSLRKIYWIERNRVWVLLKLFPVGWILASPAYTLRRLWAAWRSGRRGEGLAGELAGRHSALTLALVFCRAWLAALGGAARMLRKRREFFMRPHLPPREWESLLRRYAASDADMSFSSRE
jgi:GT2 family glycosyltransferase